MIALNFFRKPYLAYLAGMMLLFVSCKQYDSFEINDEAQKVNIKRIKNDVNNVMEYINKKNIKDFSNINKVKSILLSNKSYDDINITEDDINQAYSIANYLGLFNNNIDINTLTINLISYGYNHNLLSSTTKNFMINELSIYAISDETIKIDFQNYLTNNNLTDFEEAFISSFIVDDTSRSEGCKWVGRAVSLGTGLLIGFVATPLVGGIGGIVFGEVAEGICERA